jgi:ferredoxin-NADP reductase
VAGAALRGRLSWRTATVTGVVDETARVRTIELAAPGWPGHEAGQHVDVRLTAEDGYRAERAYSIASAPGEPLALTVERLDDGEVSPYLTEVLEEGDELELRGPIGGYFVWRPSDAEPLLLVAGGSGIVPFRAILCHRRASGSDVPVKLLVSARSHDELIYAGELEQAGDGVEVAVTLTRAQPPGWTGLAGRVDAELLRRVAWPPAERPLAFVCGPTGFVELVAGALVELGYAGERIKTERFGGMGGS